MTPFIGDTRYPDTVSGSHGDTTDDPEFAAQVVLAAVFKSPHQSVMSLIQQAFPGEKIDFYAKVLTTVRDIIAKLTGPLQKRPTGLDPSPTLLDRLSFCWRFLRQGDVLVGKLKPSAIREGSGRQEAATALHRIILPHQLQEPLLTSFLGTLRLGPDARYTLALC